MANPVNDYIDIRNDAQNSLSISTSAAQTGVIDAQGVYDVWSDVDCYVKHAVTANDVTASTGYFLQAGNVVPFFIQAGLKLGAVTSSGSGTLRWHRVAL